MFYPATHRRPAARGAMTLVELLVVIVLITTLVSTAIPIISPGGDGRRLREASRNVNAYLQGAQAKAIQTGRPFGVALRRLSEVTGRGADNAVCTVMEYVEVPPTYAGFSEGSRARIGVVQGTSGLRRIALQLVAYGANTARDTDRLPPGYDVDLVPQYFLRPGDTIEIAGRRYELLDAPGTPDAYFSDRGAQAALEWFDAQPATGGTVSVGAGYFDTRPNQYNPTRYAVFHVAPLDGKEPDLDFAHDAFGEPIGSPEQIAGNRAPYWTEPAPYRVYRQPVPAAGEPYELPGGAAIDLQASVVVDSGVRQLYDPAMDYNRVDPDGPYPNARDEPLMILFAPEGRIDRVYGLAGGAAAPQAVGGYVALCVGRRELIPARPYIEDPSRAFAEDISNPLDMTDNSTTGGYEGFARLDEVAQQEVAEQFNWLNLDSRWVLIGGQTGAVQTIEGVSVLGVPTTTGQIAGVLENAAGRRSAGGR